MLGKLKNHPFFRAVVTLASASAGGQLIMLAAMPFLTRLYTPEDFGVFAVFSALMGIVLVISSLRYELAIPLPQSQRSASRLLLIALGINLIVALNALILVAVFRFKIAEWTETPLLASFLWLLPVAIVTGGTYKALNYWAIRNKDYQKIAVTKLTQSGSNVFAQILGGLAGIGAIGLIVGQVIGQSAGINRLSKGLSFKKMRAEASKNHSLALLSRYRNFPKYDAPAAAVNVVSAQLPNVAMALLFGPAAAGMYYLADRVLAVPMSMISQAVGQVLFSQGRDDINQGAFYRRIIIILLSIFAFACMPAFLVYFKGELAFSYIFGEEWRISGLFASWLVWGLCAQLLFSPVSIVFILTEGQALGFFFHLSMLIGKILIFSFGHVIDDFVSLVKWYAIFIFVGHVIGIFICVHRSKIYSPRQRRANV